MSKVWLSHNVMSSNRFSKMNLRPVLGPIIWDFCVICSFSIIHRVWYIKYHFFQSCLEFSKIAKQKTFAFSSTLWITGSDKLWGRLATQFFPLFFGSQDIWVMPVWTDHFRGIPYLGRHLETTYGEKHQRQDRQNWHLNLTFQDTCVTCRAAFTILAMFLCYLYNIFNCIVEHEDNDQLEDHNGEFTEKEWVRGRLDWITLLPLQDSTKGTSTKSLKIQI